MIIFNITNISYHLLFSHKKAAPPKNLIPNYQNVLGIYSPKKKKRQEAQIKPEALQFLNMNNLYSLTVL